MSHPARPPGPATVPPSERVRRTPAVDRSRGVVARDHHAAPEPAEVD